VTTVISIIESELRRTVIKQRDYRHCSTVRFAVPLPFNSEVATYARRKVLPLGL